MISRNMPIPCGGEVCNNNMIQGVFTSTNTNITRKAIDKVLNSLNHYFTLF